MSDDDKAKSSFTEQYPEFDSLGLAMGMIAHDMRNSLQVIAGNADLIGLTTEEIKSKKIASRISDHVQYLSGVVDDFLIIANRNPMATMIDGGFGQHLCGTDILKIVREMSAVRSMESETVCQFTGVEETRKFMEQDAYRIIRVIMNLMNNAIDAHYGGLVHVLFDCSGQQIHIQVTDQGKGMNFKPALNSNTIEAFHSTGLGIGIVCNLVRIMDGKVAWVSNPQSTVDVYIPL